MESEPGGPSPAGDDELSRQREKRAAALLARWVPGFSGLTFGQTVAGVVLAAEHTPGPLDVERFLAGQGHDRRTIESVLAYLGPDALPHPSRRTDEIEAMTGTGTVAELPVRRSCTADADTSGREPVDLCEAPDGTRWEPGAVARDRAAGGEPTRLSSMAVGARPTEEQRLSSARRLQLLRRLQAMLLPE
jgi:hypothetical protein